MAIKGYWRLDGNSNDASGNGNNGTATNITYSQANGRLNQGAGCNGTSSRIVNTSLPYFQTKTISAWIRTGIGHAYQEILCQKTVIIDANYRAVEFRLTNSGKLQYTESNNNPVYNNIITSAVNVPLNVWVNVIVTVTGSTCKLYVNGKLTDSATFGNRLAVFTPYQNIIGAFQWTNGGAYETFFNGSIDEVLIDNTAWTPAQIKNEHSRLKGFF